MADIAGWIAAAATMIAAVMTAANLGTRVTGWGFVIFTGGALAWSTEALLTHQTNLLWSNGFLAIVDAVGIYRWLGRRAALEDGAKAAADKSRADGRPLFPILSLEGHAIEDAAGDVIAHCVGGMADRDNGRIAYLVVQLTGQAPGAGLRQLAWSEIDAGDTFRSRRSAHALSAAPEVTPHDWPTARPADASRAGAAGH